MVEKARAVRLMLVSLVILVLRIAIKPQPNITGTPT